MVRIFAFQASDPGPNPGCRIFTKKLEKIEYFYYSKNYSEIKEKKKKDNKGIKLIKTFIKDMYYKFGKANNKKDE